MSIPKLRFKADDGSGFPEWEEKRLGDIFGVVTDYVAAGSFADIANNVKYMEQPNFAQLIRTVDLKKNFKDNSPVFVDEHAFNYLWRVNLNKESIVMPNVGNVGEVYYIHPKMFLTQNNVLGPNAILLGTKEVTIFWASYLQTNNFQKKLRLIVSTGAQPKFNKTELRHIKIYRPCLEEQRKIASFLSTIDEIITTTQSELTAWEERKKGVMQKIFNREVRFKADDGSEFPEWEEKRLGAVCQYGKSHGTGLNYIGTENMLSAFGGVIIENTKLECNGILYSSGDVLMSNIRPYLKKVWLADREGVCSTDVLVFRPIKIESAYLYCLIASDSFITKVMSAAKGSKMPRGDKKHIMEMSVFIPCRLEQCKIADCLASLDDVISQIQAELSAWKGFKKGLLQQMFV